MKQYDTFRDSGVQWIGEIPSHWGVISLKRLLERPLQYGANEPAEDMNENHPRYIRITDITEDGKLRDDSWKSLPPQKAQDYLLTKGNILFARSGATVGKTYLYDENYSACFAGYLIKASCGKQILPMYLLYYTQSGLYNNWKNSVFIQSTIQNIGADKYSYLPITMPPLFEQQAIASYLDKKCTMIDRAIATQQKRIGLLQELRQNIITHAVTRGINPDTSFKNSGVEWIGEVPEHWEVKRLKHICDINGRVGYRGYTTADLVPEGEGAYTIGGKHITNNVLNLTDAEYISWVKYYESPEIMVKKGDIVTAQRGSLGKTAIVRKEIGEATINPSLVLLNNIKIFNEYLYWYMVSTPVLIAIELLNTSTAVPMVSQWQISNINIPVPPIEEQQAIVAHIESETAKLDKQVAKANRQISLLQELKQSIITEVVTGKRKVC